MRYMVICARTFIAIFFRSNLKTTLMLQLIRTKKKFYFPIWNIKTLLTLFNVS